jgi:hypothetical protein
MPGTAAEAEIRNYKNPALTMIQRIQSFWLLLAAASSIASIKFPFYTGTLVAGNAYESLNATTFIPIIILSVLSALISFATIFLFKNRSRQTWLTLLNIFISIIVIILFFLHLKDFSSGSFSLTSLFVFVVPIFLILALMGIRKDAKLIKSLDRLR